MTVDAIDGYTLRQVRYTTVYTGWLYRAEGFTSDAAANRYDERSANSLRGRRERYRTSIACAGVWGVDDWGLIVRRLVQYG